MVVMFPKERMMGSIGGRSKSLVREEGKGRIVPE